MIILTVKKSPNFRRSELLIKNLTPTQYEITYFLGSNLAQIFCEFSHPDVKHLLGITSPLQNIHEESWISQSDRSINIIPLSRISTQNYIKVCNHKGILQLGEQAMEKWKRETTEKLQKSLKNNTTDVRAILESEKHHAINPAINTTKNLYEMHMNDLVEEQEKQIKNSITKIIADSNNKSQKKIMRERMNITLEMIKKLRDEISYVILYLCEEFNRESRAQKNDMIFKFDKIMRQEQEIAISKFRALSQQKNNDSKCFQIKLNEEFESKKAEIINTKRINMKMQEHNLNKSFQKRVMALEDLLIEAEHIIKLLGEKQMRSYADNFSWKRKTCKIIHQFQKFINVVFKDKPGQVEFINLLESLLCEEYNEESESIRKKMKRKKPYTTTQTRIESFLV